jgi:uncharacterized protein YciI
MANYYALFYDVVDDFVSRRAPFREEHLGLVGEANQRGHLLLAGALDDPADRALLIFRAPDRSVVEDFVRDDPYVINGLVTHWEIRPWANVISYHPTGAGNIVTAPAGSHDNQD